MHKDNPIQENRRITRHERHFLQKQQALWAALLVPPLYDKILDKLEISNFKPLFKIGLQLEMFELQKSCSTMMCQSIVILLASQYCIMDKF